MPRERQMPSIIAQRSGQLEANFSTNIRHFLKKFGRKSYKIKTDESGLPDIYIVGGHWMESKIERRVPNARIQPLKLFTGKQRRELDALSESGDTGWAAILWEYDKLDFRVGIMPWWWFRRIQLWPLKTVYYFTDQYTTKTSLELYLDKNVMVNGLLSVKPFLERFNKWPDRDDRSYWSDTYQDAYDLIPGQVTRKHNDAPPGQ